MQDQGLDCGKYVGVYTEEAASMVTWYSECSSKNIKKSCKQKSAVYTLHNSP